MRRAWLCFFILLPAFPVWGAVDGILLNGTTGKPATGVEIALVQPGAGGLTTLGSTVADAEGKFSFTQTPKGPGLLQVSYQDVTYSKMLIPGAPTTGLAMQVYDSSRKAAAKVAQHMILLQPNGTGVTINETLIIEGDPKLTYNNPGNGTVRFYVPPGGKEAPRAAVSGAFGVALQQPVHETKQTGVYRIDYPIKPGENRVDITYSVPQGTPATFAGKILHKEGKARLVVPNGVSLKGAGIIEVGKEPQTQATIYDIQGEDYNVEISGQGSLQAAAPEAESGEDNGSPKIEQAAPHVYRQKYWITGILFAMLGLGAYLLASKRA